jgi:hypothetical protein
MIPGKIVRFLEQQASVAVAGTRDRQLVPAGHRVCGWRVGDGGRTLTAYIGESSAVQFIDAMLDNGQIAITFEEVGTLETYQLKGRYLSHAAIPPDGHDLTARLRERFVTGLRSLYMNDHLANLFRASIPPPAIAVEMEVHEVFLQTPGPGAGSRISPPAEA